MYEDSMGNRFESERKACNSEMLGKIHDIVDEDIYNHMDVDEIIKMIYEHIDELKNILIEIEVKKD